MLKSISVRTYYILPYTRQNKLNYSEFAAMAVYFALSFIEFAR